MRRVALGVLLLVVPVARAQPPRPVTPADYASVATVTELAVSPDGKQVVYCLATWDEKADNRRTDLWVVPTDGKGKPRQLTTDRANDRHPKWAVDGKAVYALRTFKGNTQVWKVPLDGAAAAVTDEKGGVVGYDYAPKADAVFYTVDNETTDADDFLELRKKYDKLDYGHGKRKVSQVLRVHPELDVGFRVLAENRYVREFAVTADGKRVAMITAADDSVIRSEGDSRVDVWDANTGKVTITDQGWKKTVASPWPWLESLAWNPDGTKIAYCTVFDGYPAEIIISWHKDGKWPATQMVRHRYNDTELHIRGYGSPLRFSGDDLNYLAESAGTNARAIRATHFADLFHGFQASRNVYAFGFGEKGGAVELAGTVEEFPEVQAAFPTKGGNSERRAITELNPQAKGWALPSVQHTTWTAPDGTQVGGVLELPPGYKKGAKKLPLVVAIHGGPTTSSKTALEFDPHNGRLYFAAAGYAVLCPNYRGSTGYGDKFTTDLIGNENDLDVKDIIAGIQHLIKEGIVDPERIGVMGWSNGGYLTNCLISLKDSPVKFKAASSGAGIVDTVAEWGFNDEPAYPRVFKKGLPWETPEIYKKTSPTYQLGNVRTPTLIHVGGNDERCPPGHSRMLYRALKEYVNVPTQLVVYPGEPHGLTKLSNRRAKMEWDLAWFDKYLKGK